MTAQAISGPDLLDPVVFASKVLGRPAWEHQAEVLRDPARYRLLLAGRQSGKSATLAIAALHVAATKRNALVLIVSAGEVAARRLLADVAAVAASSPLLAGAVIDESKSALVLTNGARIISVPASQRQIRGWSIDLLIIDEAGFIDTDLWRSAEPAIAARPGSRVLAASTPWGGPDAWFRRLWRQGTDAPTDAVRSWRWPSSISPLMDAELLAQIQEREPADYFQREFMAEWTDSAGSYFSESEIMNAVADYRMTPPEDVSVRARGDRMLPCAAGVDWGLRNDANAVVLLALMGGSTDGRDRLYIPWMEARTGWPFAEFIDRIGGIADRYWLRIVASERNGVGEFPTSQLQAHLYERETRSRVAPIWTDQRRKMSGFGRIKGLLQADRLVLPLHPPLLKELRSLEFEQAANGGVRIAVPERAGHDDLAMALLQAISCVEPRRLRDHDDLSRVRAGREYARTGSGALVPLCPMPDPHRVNHICAPDGEASDDGW